MLRFVDKITLSFAPLNTSSRSVRASSKPTNGFLQYLNTAKNRASNPKAVMTLNISDKIARPLVEVHYRDKHILKVNTDTLTAQEIVADVQRHSKKLQLAEDISQAS
ncbi:uncharacterized protein BJ171DRAFT_578714 [Polychytrium aggregatum]|uniref:uncharacterized protein n=1 Tax=Polychytrium aggregatum TaxID=110093 RepID=UPI0022FDCEBD|nr:uncharacterized protein BJ171DRAFT_578714 [Polychytrium aggregatum]KAI9207599.1 hypothetical protein BJ171DRAFT_578714 [Polychytrium aggregatum]